MPEPRPSDHPAPGGDSVTPADGARTGGSRTTGSTVGADRPGVRLRDAVGYTAGRPLTVVLDAAHGPHGDVARAAVPDGVRLVVLRGAEGPAGSSDAGTQPAGTPGAGTSGAGTPGAVAPRDGTDPAASTGDLRAAVLEHGADLGLALDAAGSAVAVVDENGDPVGEGVVAVLVGLRVVTRALDGGRGATVVHDVLASRVVHDLLGGAGAELVRTRVGPAALADAVSRHGAALGIGHGGHYLLHEPHGVGGGLVAGLHVVAALAAQPHPLSLLAELYQPYVATGVLDVEVDDAAAASERVHDAYVARRGAGPVEADTLDGLTVTHWDATPHWWFSLRTAQAGHRVRLLVEAADEDIMDKVRDDVLALLREDH